MAKEINAKDFQTFTIYLKRYLFGTSYLYTNGAPGRRRTWRIIGKPPSEKSTCSSNRAARLLMNRNFDVLFLFPFGRDIYTPEDTEQSELIKDDRPYAGLTYFGMGLHGKSNLQMNTWELIFRGS